MNVHAIRITTTEVSDGEGMDTLLPAGLPMDQVIADGAYYSIERTEAFSHAGVTPVIPPPAHAVVHGHKDTRWHDQIVKYIQYNGIYAFHKEYGYGLRSRVEAQISHIKRCIDAPLLTQKIASQESEVVIIATSLTCGTPSASRFVSKIHSRVRSTGTHTLPNNATRIAIIQRVMRSGTR